MVTVLSPIEDEAIREEMYKTAVNNEDFNEFADQFENLTGVQPSNVDYTVYEHPLHGRSIDFTTIQNDTQYILTVEIAEDFEVECLHTITITQLIDDKNTSA